MKKAKKVLKSLFHYVFVAFALYGAYTLYADNKSFVDTTLGKAKSEASYYAKTHLTK